MKTLLRFFPYTRATGSLARLTVTLLVYMSILFVSALAFTVLRIPLADKAYIAGIICAVIGLYAAGGVTVTIIDYFKK